ncbi:radical SAM protein [Clostridium tagluense]|uniref:radical SAM/SPASM domain-containing protein n=1 Tax=Clostridium tagluense TaxID=360422 RepID=UPI001CF102D1|nr:radical SAM protein [Clostridium tagluense]MCB2313237.1 radical SAM protein [Clostridium tagluense]MCB2318012.1 radical SAM protein [Clostridium tagluense]MCB2322792.1 radical SAM protein [Clostridium tagluense]MCB2327796.1 radical SAM protein [Clostridium tagluense]MCB2332443.1 radical SAM protein [Clostridium tagluense]
MINKYVLSPFTYIYIEKDKYIIGTIFDKGSETVITDIKNILPTKNLINKGIFIKRSQLEFIKNSYFNKLEDKFHCTPAKIGYIETTSICPYKCKMCPKNTNDLIRVENEMNFQLFKKIVDQLRQNEVTLHLFGDPFFDSDIYRKISYLNEKGIVPSFSTNLTSTTKIDFEKVKNININYLTISIDAIDVELFSKIRGEIDKKLFVNSFDKLNELIKISSETKCIKHFILQMIDLNVNAEHIHLIKEIVSKHNNCSFFQKQFISFPTMENLEFHSENVFEGGEKLFIYQILGKHFPFKCIKPWQKSEMGVLSDGSIVPCCLAFNSTFDIGNLNKNSLENIQNSIDLKKFRYKIWNKEDVGEVCNKCTQFKTKIKHKLIPIEMVEYLNDYCISSWN